MAKTGKKKSSGRHKKGEKRKSGAHKQGRDRTAELTRQGCSVVDLKMYGCSCECFLSTMSRVVWGLWFGLSDLTARQKEKRKNQQIASKTLIEKLHCENEKLRQEIAANQAAVARDLKAARARPVARHLKEVFF